MRPDNTPAITAAAKQRHESTPRQGDPSAPRTRPSRNRGHLRGGRSGSRRSVDPVSMPSPTSAGRSDASATPPSGHPHRVFPPVSVPPRSRCCSGWPRRMSAIVTWPRKTQRIRRQLAHALGDQRASPKTAAPARPPAALAVALNNDRPPLNGAPTAPTAPTWSSPPGLPSSDPPSSMAGRFRTNRTWPRYWAQSGDDAMKPTGWRHPSLLAQQDDRCPLCDDAMLSIEQPPRSPHEKER